MTDYTIPTKDEAEAWLAKRDTVTTLEETGALLDEAQKLIERIVAAHERPGSMWKPGDSGQRPLRNPEYHEPKEGETGLVMIYDEGREVAALTADGRMIYAAAGVEFTRAVIPAATRFEHPETDAGLDRTTAAVNSANIATALGLEHVW